MKNLKGFTLLELLVVVAVISILALIGVVGFDKARARAREQTCRNNLKQLSAAVLHYADDHSQYMPQACDYEYYNGTTGLYELRKGWVAWVKTSSPLDDVASHEGWNSKESLSSKFTDDTGCWEHAPGEKPSKNPVLTALEAGMIYDYVIDAQSFVCPVIERAVQERYAAAKQDDAKRLTVSRTYAMNQFFGCPTNRRWHDMKTTHVGTSEGFGGHVPDPAKVMLFCEVFPDYTSDSYGVARTGYKDDMRNKKHTHDCLFNPEAFDSVSEKDDIMCFDPEMKGNEAYGVHLAGDPGYHGTLVIFFDGHIENIYPRHPERGSDGEIVKLDKNAGWFLSAGFEPSNVKPQK